MRPATTSILFPIYFRHLGELPPGKKGTVFQISMFLHTTRSHSSPPLDDGGRNCCLPGSESTFDFLYLKTTASTHRLIDSSTHRHLGHMSSTQTTFMYHSSGRSKTCRELTTGELTTAGIQVPVVPVAVALASLLQA